MTSVTNISPSQGYAPGGTDVAVADGGTGSSTAAGARTNLGAGSSAAVALNTTHRSSDGTDHANVVLADTHRGLTNNPHTVTAAQASAVALSTTVSPRWSRTLEVVAGRSTHGLADVADIVASPDTGWSWKNSGNLSSAAISSSVLETTHSTGGGDNDAWLNGNYSCPTYTTPVERLPHGSILLQAHMRIGDATTPATFEGAGIIADAGENDRYLYLGIHQHGAANTNNYRIKMVRGGNNEVAGVAAITVAQAATGLYMAMAITPSGTVMGAYRLGAYTGALDWKAYDVSLSFAANHFLLLDSELDCGIYNMAFDENPPTGLNAEYQWLAIDRPERV